MLDFFFLFPYLYFLSPFTVITTSETVVSKRGGIVMVDSRHPNMSVITAKADQLITITTHAGNNLITQWFHGSQLGRIERLVGHRSARTLGIASRPTGWSARQLGIVWITGVMVACKC